MRELKAIEVLPQPKSPIAIYAPGTYQRSKEKKIAAVTGYLSIVPYLPPLDNRFKHPTSGMTVCTDKTFSWTRMTRLRFIDWQATELAPLYNHIPEPYVLDYDGPPLSSLLHRPSLEEVEAALNLTQPQQKKQNGYSYKCH
jgi:hypothetical protein